jgi:hypothetical protein
MKSSLIPTSVSAPMPAPIAAPRKGTKKISPNRKPQNAPPRANAPARRLAAWLAEIRERADPVLTLLCITGGLPRRVITYPRHVKMECHAF